MSDPLLKIGCPAEKHPASYSRFALPFSYELHKISGSHEAIGVDYERFRPKEGLENYDGRRKYLTVETQKALFETAAWFRLRDVATQKPYAPSFAVNSGGREVLLRVESANLVLFEFPVRHRDRSGSVPQVGFLLLDVHFIEGQSVRLSDLMLVNEYFRYFDCPFEEKRAKLETFFGNGLEHFIDHRLLAACDRAKQVFGEERETGSRELFNWWRCFLSPSLDLGEDRRAWLDIGSLPQQNAFPDNRAFVWTAAVIPDGARGLGVSDSKLQSPERVESWVRLLNIDEPPGGKLGDFEIEWAKDRTYCRWAKLGSYYGFASHSGAMLSAPMTDPPTHMYFRQMYFDQTLILLYCRVVLFCFSDRLGEITDVGRTKWMRRFSELYWQFTRFTNLYRFPLLSNQQQGLEMYEIARRGVDVEELFREIQDEVRNSYEFHKHQEELRLASVAERLSKLATIGLVVTVVIGFLAIPDVFDAIYAFLAQWMGAIPPAEKPRSVLNTKFFVALFLVSAAFGFGFLFLKRIAGFLAKRFGGNDV